MKKLFFILLLSVSSYMYSQDDFIVKTKPIESKELRLTKDQIFIKNEFPFIGIDKWTKELPFFAYDTRNKKFIPIKIDSIIKEKEYIGNENQIVKAHIYKFKGIDSYFEASERITEATDYIEHVLIGTKLYWIIYAGDIQKAREVFIGKMLYTLTDDWDIDGEYPQKNIRARFVPVVIRNVGISDNPSYPVKIIFEASDKNEYFVNVKLSGTNSGGLASVVFGKDFVDTFSFKNPKTNYPQISSIKWKLISKGEVQLGMTKEECILSWGHPKSINTTIGSYGTDEQWVYSGQSYLYFKKGKLSSIQN